MIIGIGTDIVKIDRINRIIDKFAQRFPKKILSTHELLFYQQITNHHNKIAYLAKRFAAKEALSKATGLGIGRLGFKNINILNNNLGKPYVRFDIDLHQFLKIDKSININNEISLSDEKNYAVAFALIWT